MTVLRRRLADALRWVAYVTVVVGGGGALGNVVFEGDLPEWLPSFEDAVPFWLVLFAGALAAAYVWAARATDGEALTLLSATQADLETVRFFSRRERDVSVQLDAALRANHAAAQMLREQVLLLQASLSRGRLDVPQVAIWKRPSSGDQIAFYAQGWTVAEVLPAGTPFEQLTAGTTLELVYEQIPNTDAYLLAIASESFGELDRQHLANVAAQLRLARQ